MKIKELWDLTERINKNTSYKIEVEMNPSVVHQGYYQLYTEHGRYELPVHPTDDEDKCEFTYEYIKSFIKFLNNMNLEEVKSKYSRYEIEGTLTMTRMYIREDFEVEFFSKNSKWIKHLNYNPFKMIDKRNEFFHYQDISEGQK